MKKLFLGLETPILKETPDMIDVGANSYWWKSKGATAFMILTDDNLNSALIYVLEGYEDATHRKMLETLFNTMMYTKLNLAQLIEADNTLEEYGLAAIKNPNSVLPELTYEDIGALLPQYSANHYDDSLVFGRVWKVKEGDFISTWEDPKKVEPYKDVLVNFLVSIDVDPTTSKWELRGPKFKMGDFRTTIDKADAKFVSMDEFFGSDVKQKPDERLPHTMAGLGKALGREASGFGSYKQAEIASKAKMPFAQYHAMVQQESVKNVLRYDFGGGEYNDEELGTVVIDNMSEKDFRKYYSTIPYIKHDLNHYIKLQPVKHIFTNQMVKYIKNLNNLAKTINDALLPGGKIDLNEGYFNGWPANLKLISILVKNYGFKLNKKEFDYILKMNKYFKQNGGDNASHYSPEFRISLVK